MKTWAVMAGMVVAFVLVLFWLTHIANEVSREYSQWQHDQSCARIVAMRQCVEDEGCNPSLDDRARHIKDLKRCGGDRAAEAGR